MVSLVISATGQSGQPEIARPATPRTRQHRFATHLMQRGSDLRTVQGLLRHADVATTMIYIHVLRVGEVLREVPWIRYWGLTVPDAVIGELTQPAFCSPQLPRGLPVSRQRPAAVVSEAGIHL